MTQAIIPHKFVNRDFVGATSDLLTFVRETRPEVFSDFAQSSLGMLLIDLAAAVVDNVSYGQDAAATEVYLATCRRYESALAFARSVGYTPRPATAATAILVSREDAPSALVTHGGLLRKGQGVTGTNGLRYEVVEDLNIPPGSSTVRVQVREGRSYEESWSPVSVPNYVVAGSRANVADGSWVVFVGDTANPANQWTQVESIFTETTASHTYAVSFDTRGRVEFKFGDNISGAIPIGIITARYRDTSGLVGNAPAGAIKGALSVDIASPGTGKYALTFENYEELSAAVGTTQAQTGEVVSTTAGLPTAVFLLGYAPVVAGTVQITVNTALGAIVLRDDLAGGFVTYGSNVGPAGPVLVSGTIVYSGGSVALLFSTNLAAGHQITADYDLFTSSDNTQITVTGSATGGDDRESIDEMRVNIPSYIRTQDRLITGKDYVEGLLRVAAIELAFAAVWNTAYNGNVVKLYVWSKEQATLLGVSRDGTSVVVPYTRYLRASDALVRAVQSFIKPRTLLTVHHIVERPEIMWVDVYLGVVEYDRRVSAQSVRSSITAAIASTFESFNGFQVKIAEIYNAVRDVLGVLSFNVDRVVLGHKDQSSVVEPQGTTGAVATVSGTLQSTTVSPGSVKITVKQSLGLDIVIVDNSVGGFTVLSGGGTVTGTINYLTGGWSATFGVPLVAGNTVVAAYRDVQRDFRRVQLVAAGDPVAPDHYPPPLYYLTPSVSYPYGEPLRDGRPLGDPAVSSHQYEPIQDINLAPLATGANYYDETFLYNDEILYDSDDAESGNIRAINCRRVYFDLTAK